MKKKLLKFFTALTLLAVLVFGLILHFNYYALHLIAQPFYESENYTEETPYDFIITSASISMGSWDSSTAYLNLDIYNAGISGTNDYCLVSLVMVKNSNNQPFMVAADTDTRTWTSEKTTTLSIPINLDDLSFGQYSLYFQIRDDGLAQNIPLDNRLSCDKNGYYIGSLSISHFLF